MNNEKRLIDANEFWNRLQNVVYDIFTAHEKDGQLTGTASVGYYTTTIEEVLKRTKTADAVEVVHGRWIPNYEYDFDRGEHRLVGYHCDQCGIWTLKKSNYCPNCGAKSV